MKNNKLIMNVSDYTLIINYKYYKDIFYTYDQVVLYKNSDIISSIYRYIHNYDDSILQIKKIINLKDCLLNYKNVKYYLIKNPVKRRGFFLFGCIMLVLILLL